MQGWLLTAYFLMYRVKAVLYCWRVAFFFTLQIYGDFSGYSNMARGMSRLLGIRLVENFKTPYLSANISEFWRRWHVSLSEWLRDYLYIPLGGNRGGSLRTRTQPHAHHAAWWSVARCCLDLCYLGRA